MSGELHFRRQNWGLFEEVRLQVFVTGGSDRHLWLLSQTSPNGDWSDWVDLSVYRPLDVEVDSAAVGNAADGRLAVFVTGPEGHLWHLAQTSPNGDWSSSWVNLGGYRPLYVKVDSAAVGNAADGRLEVFVTDHKYGHLWHLYQTPPNGDWTRPNGDWSAWEDLSRYGPFPVGGIGFRSMVAVGSAADGRLAVFVTGWDGHLWHLHQTSPNGDWSDWVDLSVYRPLGVVVETSAAVGSAADGRLAVFVMGQDGHLWHLSETSPNGDWSDWVDLSVYRPLDVGYFPSRTAVAVGSAADGRLAVFFVNGSDGHLWHLSQTSPNGDWSDWVDLNVYRPLGVGVTSPAVGNAADGRLAVFVTGPEGHLWHLSETSPNGDWSDWVDLSVYRPLDVRVDSAAVGRAGWPI
jgi:hypothetical protein